MAASSDTREVPPDLHIGANDENTLCYYSKSSQETKAGKDSAASTLPLGKMVADQEKVPTQGIKNEHDDGFDDADSVSALSAVSRFRSQLQQRVRKASDPYSYCKVLAAHAIDAGGCGVHASLEPHAHKKQSKNGCLVPLLQFRSLSGAVLLHNVQGPWGMTEKCIGPAKYAASHPKHGSLRHSSGLQVWQQVTRHAHGSRHSLHATVHSAQSQDTFCESREGPCASEATVSLGQLPSRRHAKATRLKRAALHNSYSTEHQVPLDHSTLLNLTLDADINHHDTDSEAHETLELL